ncbi:Disease resistance protein RGA2 [Bienertia sinuspersici]
MEVGVAFAAAQTLFAALKCTELKDICSLSLYKSRLDELQRTVATVMAVLRDAETKELTEEAQNYIEELKDAVYDADDLFDEFVTLAKQTKVIKGGDVPEKFGMLFSRYNDLAVSYNMSQGVRKIRNKLDAIANNHAHFGFSVDPQPMRLRREETCSYAYEGNIVGREDDVSKIINHLTNNSNAPHSISFVSIVGMGGLGKTALAQLVFNHERVSHLFQLKMWVCVSDHDQEQLDITQILCKILASVTGEKQKDCTMDWLQTQVRKTLTNKKYLLVLDDVWTENRNQWLKLVDFLLGDESGSRILVTTRSHETARIVGNGPKHELEGLSKDNSWLLFKKIAFVSEQSNPPEDLVKIGLEIVEGCGGVPLAIRMVASLLYGQDKSKWLSFQKSGLSNSAISQKDIMPILKFSYHQLESPLKCCFTYCALFPKDYVIEKELLISLWIAQGYIIPLNDGPSMEDVAEEYISILLRRCFFQDVKIDEEFGKIKSFKIHDLIHDIAVQVGGKEICVRKFPPSDHMEKKIRHVAYTKEEFLKNACRKTHIRSYCYLGKQFIKFEMNLSSLKELLSNWMHLRALDLVITGLSSLPDSIGELLHLRYLNLKLGKNLEVLPESITKLYNLQTLKLGWCSSLRELPKDFPRLVNLRKLEISNCGIQYLTSLGTLFHLKTLKLISLIRLQYIITGTITTSEEDGKSSAKGLLSFPSLKVLHLEHLLNLKEWRNSRVEEGDTSGSSSMPPSLLPQLKSLRIESCEVMKCNLLCPNLEDALFFDNNESLQVNDRVRNEIWKATSTALSSSLAGSYGVPKLRRVIMDRVKLLNRMPMGSFQCLQKLIIELNHNFEGLGEVEDVFVDCSSSLRHLEIRFSSTNKNRMRGGSAQGCYAEGDSEKRIGMALSSLHHLTLRHLQMLKCLPNWMQFLTALQTLDIIDVRQLEALPEWMPKLTSLRELRLDSCSKSLKKRCQPSNGEDWPLIQHIPSIYLKDFYDHLHFNRGRRGWIRGGPSTPKV